MVTQTQNTSRKMPALTGSEKQVAWATTIRREVVEVFTTQAGRIKAALATDGITTDGELALDGILVAMRRILGNEGTSRYWIDNRANINREMVEMVDQIIRFYVPGTEVIPTPAPQQTLLGTFTLVTEDGAWTTLKLEACDITDRYTGTTSSKVMASYLSGSNNESDYQGFAWVEGQTPRVWRRFAGIPQVAALAALLSSGDEGMKAAGFAYAKESGNCWVCGRKLTTPQSLELGIGRVCADKLAA